MNVQKQLLPLIQPSTLWGRILHGNDSGKADKKMFKLSFDPGMAFDFTFKIPLKPCLMGVTAVLYGSRFIKITQSGSLDELIFVCPFVFLLDSCLKEYLTNRPYDQDILIPVHRTGIEGVSPALGRGARL